MPDESSALPSNLCHVNPAHTLGLLKWSVPFRISDCCYSVFLITSVQATCPTHFNVNLITPVIPNLGYAYPRLGITLTGARKKLNNGGKRHMCQHCKPVTTYKFEITATILITNILLIWRVQFMEIGCQGVGKWKKFGNHQIAPFISGEEYRICRPHYGVLFFILQIFFFVCSESPLVVRKQVLHPWKTTGEVMGL